MHWGEEPFLPETLKDFFLLRSLFRFCLSRLQWKLSIRTPLFKGYLHSGDTKVGPKKMSHNLCTCYLYLGERDNFVGPKAQVLLPFSRVPINAHVCVFCNQKSKRTNPERFFERKSFTDTEGHLCNNLGNPKEYHQLAIFSNWGICPPNTI